MDLQLCGSSVNGYRKLYASSASMRMTGRKAIPRCINSILQPLILGETKATLRAEIVNPNMFSVRGRSLEKTMEFELTPELTMDIFGEYIKSHCHHVVEDEYERREIARVTQEQEELMATMLSEAASMDCDWENS